MKRYVALLRGINVGGNNKVEMKKLKVMFEDMGFGDVSTYINSGNVLFSAAEVVDVTSIETEIEKTFGFFVRTLVREKKDILKIVEAVPAAWENSAGQKTDVLFLWPGYDSKKSIELLKITDGVDELLYEAKSIIWHIDRKDYNKSGMNDFIGTELYKNMTARNINTVRKLASLLEA
ncbi:DUF1697 domain-containing protein [Candidatus Nomurabacteria bacterium]|nr:DUF1697 domain-containing protein [Candidatus Nomurabacteria bacterium]